jgi:isoleucyl-tRNA synthetase
LVREWFNALCSTALSFQHGRRAVQFRLKKNTSPNNKKIIKLGFPADFIGEGIDQTRGWFYTLNVVSTALGRENPYKNLIVNGLVLAADGKKMSKRLQNYTDPLKIVALYGADAVRLYLMNSPLVQAGNLNFKDDGVRAVLKDIFLPWYHTYRFLIQNVSRWEIAHNSTFQFNESHLLTEGALSNIMDRSNISLKKISSLRLF